MDSHVRSIAKALSWRFLATIITFCVAWLITGAIAGAIADRSGRYGGELGIYYAHERAWDRVAFGRREPKDYEI